MEISDIRKLGRNNSDRLNCPLEPDEVAQAVKKLKDGTSPGPDGSTLELSKAIFGYCPKIIWEFCNDFLESDEEGRLVILARCIVFINKNTEKENYKKNSDP